jgi:hypothetical protein
MKETKKFNRHVTTGVFITGIVEQKSLKKILESITLLTFNL